MEGILFVENGEETDDDDDDERGSEVTGVTFAETHPLEDN
jgi:hypothetical protein